MKSLKQIFIESKKLIIKRFKNKICGDCFLPKNACNCNNNIDNQKRSLIDKEIIENKLKNSFIFK